MTDSDERYGRRALEMAIATNALLESHLKECNSRYGQMIERGNERHENLSKQLDGIKSATVAVACFLVTGLITIIGILLHNGGHL